jgi:Caspase domain
MSLLDPTSTVAIILGAYDWTRAGQVRAPSFRRSAAFYQNYLLTQRPHGLGIQPDRVFNLFNDPSPAGEQLDRLHDHITSFISESRETGHPIRDILIYYVGHGSCDRGHLHLLVRHSSAGREEQSSISVTHLPQELRTAAPQQRRIVILDCCFSEAAATAFGAMGAMDEALAATAIKNLEPGIPPPERGTLLFCSSPRHSVSFGPPNDEWTLFTGALLNVLQEGSISRPEMLSFSDLREDVYNQMLGNSSSRMPPRPALHQTDQQSGDLTRLPAFPNAAWARRKTQEEQRAAEARRKAEAEERAAEARLKAEEEKRAIETRLKAEEEKRAIETRLKAEEEKRAIETRLKAEEEKRAIEARRKAEEEKRVAEARRKAGEEKRAAEARRKAEEEARAAEAHRNTEEEEQARASTARRQGAVNSRIPSIFEWGVVGGVSAGLTTVVVLIANGLSIKLDTIFYLMFNSIIVVSAVMLMMHRTKRQITFQLLFVIGIIIVIGRVLPAWLLTQAQSSIGTLGTYVLMSFF